MPVVVNSGLDTMARDIRRFARCMMCMGELDIDIRDDQIWARCDGCDREMQVTKLGKIYSRVRRARRMVDES